MTVATSATMFLRIHLDQDVVLSGTAASTGLHQTLGHIPGSVLLGLAAASYEVVDAIDPGLSWSVFHGSGVRFGNGLPLVQGQMLVPLPNNRRDLEKSRRKDGFVSKSGWYVWPDQSYRRRTAIDPGTGRALEATLFGYSSLRAGQSFVSRVEIGSECAQAQNVILAALAGAPVWIGRSRGAEYGRVIITRLERPPDAPTHGDLADQTIRFYAVSDCAFATRGLPGPEILGLPADWTLAPDDSAITWRRYAPFNGYRQAFDAERIVLAQGSVVAFRGRSLDHEHQRHVRATLDRGVGMFVGEGLGVLLANPTVIDMESKDLVDPPIVSSIQSPTPDDALFHWLRRRHGDWILRTLARDRARHYEGRFGHLYRELWREGRLLGMSPNRAAPSRAQWGSVRDAGLRAVTLEALTRCLFDPAEGVCTAGTGAAPWQRAAPALQLRDQPASAAALLGEVIDRSGLELALTAEGQPPDLADALAQMLVADLAVQVPRAMGEVERGPK